MKIYFVKLNEVLKKWYVIDVIGKLFGRFVVKIVVILRGKYKFQFILNVDIGDYVIVINVEKVVLIGKKFDKDGYRYYIKYLGGFKFILYCRFFEKYLEKVIEIVVCGMFFKNRFRDRFMRKFKVYRGLNYLYVVQKLEVLEIQFCKGRI